MIRNLVMVVWALFQAGSLYLCLPALHGEVVSLSPGLADMKQKNWTQEQGLPRNALDCLLQTRDGWLWIGTRSGLARFDGVRFTLYDGHTPGFTDDAILDLAEDAQGDLWIATKKGLYRKQGGRFTKFTTANGLLHDHVTQLLVGRDATLWAATQTGLSSFKGDGFTNYPFTETVHDLAGQHFNFHQVMTLTEDPSGFLWLGTMGGLYQFDPKLKNFLPVWQDAAPSLLEQMVPTQAVLVDQEGNLWCGTDRILAWRQAGVWRHFRFEVDEGDARLRHIRQGPDGTIWIVQAGQLLRWEGDTLVREDDRLGLGDSYITDLLFDREGLIWVATRYNGLVCLLPTTLRVFTTRDGLCHNTVTSVCASRDNGVWVGTVKGLMQWRDGQFVFPEVNPSVRRWTCRSVFEESNGDVWLAGVEINMVNTKVLRRNGSSYRSLQVMATGYEQAAFFCDQSDRLWVGGRKGIACFIPGRQLDLQDASPAPNLSVLYTNRPFSWCFAPEVASKVESAAILSMFTHGQWQALSGPFLHTNWVPWSLAPDNLVADSPIRLGQYLSCYDARWFLEDARGAIWLGTWGGGLNRIWDGFVDVFTHRDGLADDHIRTLYLDSQGGLWIGTTRGLSWLSLTPSRHVPPQIVSFTTREGLPDEAVNQILEDSAKNLWIGCNAGIYRVARTDLAAVASGQIAQVQCLLLNEDAGMLSTDTYTGSQPSACQTPDGRLWFCTAYGLAVVDPARIARQAVIPKVFIERIRTGGDWIEIFDSDPDARGRSSAGVRSSIPQGASENQSSGISAPVPDLHLPAGSGNSLEIEFTALHYAAPHRLRFRYRLEGVDPDWRESVVRRSVSYANLKPDTYRFEIQASGRDFAWNTTQASFAITIAPFFWQTQWFRMLLISIMLCLILALVLWRIQVLRRWHAFEKAQMLAVERDRMARDLHDDLAADLARIAMLETNPSGPRPADVARDALDKLGGLIWATDPHFDTLSDLAAYLRQLIHQWVDPRRLALRLEFPEPLPPQRVTNPFRRQLTLVVKEALSNAIRHGQPSLITVGLKLTSQKGHGQPPGLELWIQDDGCGFDPGRPTEEWVHRSGQNGRGLGSMRRRIQDLGGELHIDTAPGKGTTIRVQVPLPKAG